MSFPSFVHRPTFGIGDVHDVPIVKIGFPLAPSVGNQLAKNLLVAQAAAPYTQFEPDSLQLSIDAVRGCDSAGKE